MNYEITNVVNSILRVIWAKNGSFSLWKSVQCEPIKNTYPRTHMLTEIYVDVDDFCKAKMTLIANALHLLWRL